MERKVKAEEAVSLGGMTIVPLVEVRLGYRRINGVHFFSGTKHPWAVVVIIGEQEKAFDIDGNELPVEDVLAKVKNI